MEEDISTSSEKEVVQKVSQPEAPRASQSQGVPQEPEKLVPDPEVSRMKVFFGKVFPKAEKFMLEDGGHPLNSRNLVYDSGAKTIFEVRCFERPGVHFFGQRVLSQGDVFGITPLSPFYLILPYLWGDLRYNEEKGGKASLKSVYDLLLEDRSHYKAPHNLKPIGSKLKEILNVSMEQCLPLLRATCVTQDAGSDLYLKLDRSKLFAYLKKKTAELTTFIVEKGHLLEYSLLKKEFKHRDAQEFALEHVSGVVSAEVFSDLVKELGLKEEELFKKEENPLKRALESPMEKEGGRTKFNKGSKSPAPKEKEQPATSTGNKTTLHSFFGKKP